jgi:type I restriction enzyme S subunit
MNSVAKNGWQVKLISDIANVGSSKRIMQSEYVSHGVPFFRSKEVILRSKKNPIKDPLYISRERYEEIKSKFGAPKKDEILITAVGTIGTVYLIEDIEFYFKDGNLLWVNRIDDAVNPTYLAKYLASDIFQIAIDGISGGSSQSALTIEKLSELEFNLPPLPEQQKIAAILTSVDDVIESTQAQIKKLKDLKTGMMQELLTKGIGRGGLPHTEFKDSAVGRIPKAWEVLPLGTLAKLERGKFSQRPRNDPAFYGGSIPFLQTGDIPKESPFITRFTQTLNEKGLSVSKLFVKETLVITIAATIGEIGLLKFDSCFPDSLVGITVHKDVADPVFIMYTMRARKDDLEALAPQTAQKNINLDILNPFLLASPPLKEQQLIGKNMAAVDLKIEAATKKYEHYLSIKKALMQDLLTGKVRVNVS